MKRSLDNVILSIISLFLLFVGGVNQSMAQSAPYITVLGHISPDSVVNRNFLAGQQGKTRKVEVPPERASAFSGFDTGFAAIVNAQGAPTMVQGIKITRLTFGLYSLDALTGIEAPILLPNGQPATGIQVNLFTLEASTARPNVFTAPNINNSVHTTNTNLPVVGTATQNVGTVFLTQHRLNWRQIPSLVAPALNKGYVLRYDLRLEVTHNGVVYPIVVDPETTKFTYVVKEVTVPNMTHMFVPPHGDQAGSVTFKGAGIEWWSLETSTDLVNWGDISPVSSNGYVASDSYRWMFAGSSSFPRRFFRLKWQSNPNRSPGL